jgi:serine phosphatase RsbU (regulator of sigma subunit)
MKLISLIFLPVIFFGNPLFAQDFLEITSIEEANKRLSNFIYLYEDSTSALDITQILDKKEQNNFLPLKQFFKKRSSEYTYWLYFSINNDLTKDSRLGLLIPKQNHEVDIYCFTDSLLFNQKTGLYIDESKNDEVVPFSNIIQIKGNKRIDLFIAIKNITDELPNFSIKFVNLDKAIKKNYQSTVFDGFENGMMWLMIMYGLFLFFLNRDKLYLFYSLYVFFTSVYFLGCLGFGYRWFPEIPRKLFSYTDIPDFLGLYFYFQFIRLFVNSLQKLPKWDKILKALGRVVLIMCIIIPVLIYFTNKVILIMTYYTIIGQTIMILCALFVIKLFFLKDKLANIIAVGSLFLLVGNIIGIAIFLMTSVGSDNESGFIYQKLGTLTELIIFTFGISYRYALIVADKQKFQKQLIIQLNENAELQGKVNRELSEKVKEATAEIVARNKEITDSIRYASLIQTAVLPPIDFITEWGIDNFILYKPKEVVSGDFYWGKKRNGKIIIAAGDCTGHGVPGAFMSMLGHAFLDEIINTVEPDNAAAILDRLRDEVITTLKQKGNRGEAKDGMDMALCIIDKKAGQLMYSGANNPLYLIRDDNLIKIEADKMPIGIYSTFLVPFTNQTIEIKKGDHLYLFSDGFADQFGGPYGKKFMYKPFQDLINQNHTKPMDQQKEILDNTFEEWRGEREQIDDVMVIGLRI